METTINKNASNMQKRDFFEGQVSGYQDTNASAVTQAKQKTTVVVAPKVLNKIYLTFIEERTTENVRQVFLGRTPGPWLIKIIINRIATRDKLMGKKPSFVGYHKICKRNNLQTELVHMLDYRDGHFF